MLMDHEQLAERIEKRIDKLEIKLDHYLQLEQQNHADLQWVKAYIKLSITALISLTGAVVAGAIKIFA